MARWASIRTALLLSGALVIGVVGCDDEEDFNPNADAGGEEQTCEEQMMEERPGTSPGCTSCLCENCESEFAACADSEGCFEQVDCASDVVADGTCSADDTGCVISECEPNSEAIAYLTCIQEKCLDACTGGGDMDGGVEDGGVEDAGGGDAGTDDAGTT
ncbi:MAG: hypothetical protein ACODAU_02165 [Myxococcota bacterium]